MNTEQLEKFKLLTSKLAEDLVDIYNESIQFSKFPESERGRKRIHRCCITLREDLQNISRLSKLVFTEAYENKREQKLKEKAQKISTARKTIKENPNAHKPPSKRKV